MKIDKNTNLAELNQSSHGTMIQNLGIEYTEIGDDYVCGRMPVDERTWRPGHILHGGANIAFAETIGGLGSLVLIDGSQYDVRGSSITANHVGSATGGWVYARAEIIHQGKRTHLWNIDITDQNQRLISTIRLTNFIVPR